MFVSWTWKLVFLLKIFSIIERLLADVTLLLLVDVGLVFDEAVAFAESPRTEVAGEPSLVLVKNSDVA